MRTIYARSVAMIESATNDAQEQTCLLTAVSAVNKMMRDEESVSSTSSSNPDAAHYHLQQSP